MYTLKTSVSEPKSEWAKGQRRSWSQDLHKDGAGSRILKPVLKPEFFYTLPKKHLAPTRKYYGKLFIKEAGAGAVFLSAEEPFSV